MEKVDIGSKGTVRLQYISFLVLTVVERDRAS